MWKKRIRNASAQRMIVGILLFSCAVYCAAFVKSASAQDDTPFSHPHPTPMSPTITTQPQVVERQTPVLTISPMGLQKIGHSVQATATLLNAQGVPQANKPLLIFVDGQQVRRDRTDQNGMSAISVGSDLPLGDHQLQVQFIGTAAYFGVSATTTFTVIPFELRLETVPPLAGIPVSVNGQVIATDSKGLAVVDIGIAGAVNLEVLQKPDANIDDNTRASFVRWSDESFQAKRTLNIANDSRIQIGLSVSHPITHTFVDLSGNPVDFSKISSMQVRTSMGGLVSFRDSQPLWVTATEIARRRTGLEATNILYSVESVTIDGTNVVNRYQQHFLAEANTPWQIQLLLYSVNVTADDALFGFPVGTGISLQYPDSHVQSLTFGANKTLSPQTLPRGTYQVKVDGIRSLTGWTPIALSRDQAVQIQVFSYLDVAVILAVGVVIGFAMLFYGRPFLLRLPLVVYRRLHGRSKPQNGAQAGERGSFNITFFHSSAIDNMLSTASAPNKMAANSRRTGNIIQISGSKGSHTGRIAINYFPVGRLICVANRRSKRGQLLIDLIYQWQIEIARRSTVEIETLRPEVSRTSSRVGIFADICEIYASLPQSKRNRYKPEQFDFKSTEAQCKNCEGKGRFPSHIVAEDYIVCPVCRGKGYKLSILNVKLDGKNIADVLNMTVTDSAAFFANYPKVKGELESLQQLGFGEVIVGEPGVVLNTKGILNIDHIRQHIGHNLYIFHAPLGKMSAANTAHQVTTLAQLLDRGSTIRIIEDNTVPTVIENPVVMLKLGVEHVRGNVDASATAQGGTPMLGMNGSV